MDKSEKTVTTNSKHATYSVMRQIILSTLTSVFLLGILLSSSGCVAILAGGAAGGGTAYALGDLEVTLSATAKQAQVAIQRGASDLGLRKISGSGDELEGKYVFRTAADKKVTVSYGALSPGMVELEIRVGTFGDEGFSQRIYDAIQKRL